MRGRRQPWNRARSTHAEVLESLEHVIARHPAAASRERTAPGELLLGEAEHESGHFALPEVDVSIAEVPDRVVVPFRRKIRAGLVPSDPSDAA